MTRDVRLMARTQGPGIVPPGIVAEAMTYREAVRLCWTLRVVKGMKVTDLARDFDFIRQHVGDYLNPDDKPSRRSLPAERVADFEEACGNTAITQWLASRQRLTVLEEMQAERMAA